MPATRLRIVAKTDVGLVRTNNEDNFIVTSSMGSDKWVVPHSDFTLDAGGCAYVVADGMGGESAGEVASELAVQRIKHSLSQNPIANMQEMELLRCMEASLELAHQSIIEYGDRHPESHGLGTTATICVMRGDKLFISWIGDSRVYRYSNNGKVTANNYNIGPLEILTDDHSMVWDEVRRGKMSPEQARVAPNSNIITQSLGDSYKTPRPESRIYPYYKGDLIISCSDGLNGMLSDSQIKEIVEHASDRNLLADLLIYQAKQAGGKDNITLALCECLDGPIYVAPSEDKTAEIAYEPVAKSNFLIKFLILAMLLVGSGFLYFTGELNGVVSKLEKLISSKTQAVQLEPNVPVDSLDVEVSDSQNVVKPTFKKVISEPVQSSIEKGDDQEVRYMKSQPQNVVPLVQYEDESLSVIVRQESGEKASDSEPIVGEMTTQVKGQDNEEIADDFVYGATEELFIGDDPEVRSLLNKIAVLIMDNDTIADMHKNNWRKFNSQCNEVIKADDEEGKTIMLTKLNRMYARFSKK